MLHNRLASTAILKLTELATQQSSRYRGYWVGVATLLGDTLLTNKNSLHIPLWQGRQVAFGRRAVGAAIAVTGAFFCALQPEKPINRAFRVKR